MTDTSLTVRDTTALARVEELEVERRKADAAFQVALRAKLSDEELLPFARARLDAWRDWGAALGPRETKAEAGRKGGSSDGSSPLADAEKKARERARKVSEIDEGIFETYKAADDPDQLTLSGLLNKGRSAQPPTDTPPLPAGVFATIVADPPWDVKAGPPVWGGSAPSQALEYPTMDVETIAALDVRERAADHAHLYLWTINKYVEDAYDIAREWGFKPSTLLTWCKPPHGLGLGGNYVLTSEFILFATRGALAAQSRVDTSWFTWPRRKHSVKPDEFYDLIEGVSPGPYLEMFARRPRDGWEIWGNEA